MFWCLNVQQPGYDVIAQFMIRYILLSNPIVDLLFKIYGMISTIHALSFLFVLKLVHYMKIPPRCMYTMRMVLTTSNIYFNFHNDCNFPLQGVIFVASWTMPFGGWDALGSSTTKVGFPSHHIIVKSMSHSILQFEQREPPTILNTSL